MHRSSRSVILVVSLVALLVGLALPAAASNPNYATCIQCHPLPIDQAKGLLGPHPADVGVAVYPPLPPETVCAGCHLPVTHNSVPTSPRYLWNWATDPNSYPAGPSVITQMCEDCHNGTLAPAAHISENSHPFDHIPYLPNSLSVPTPTSILPLYTGAGIIQMPPAPDVGLVCSTCHDPHNPSYAYNAKTPFLRIGRTRDITNLCGYCHQDLSPVSGYELVIPDLVYGITMGATGLPDTLIFNLTIKNRGNATYTGSSQSLIVQAEDISGNINEIGRSLITPTLGPDMQGPFSISCNIAGLGLSGEAVIHFILPGSSLNPERTYEFVKSFTVSVPPPEALEVTSTTDSTVSLSWLPPANVGVVTYNVYRNGQKANPVSLSTTFFTDDGLPPETPATYTVQAVDSTGKLSPMSNRVGAETQAGTILYVPEQRPTIAAAIADAGPGTSIHVAPGRYLEQINLMFKDRITIRGRDANACILETGPFTPINLDQNAGANTLRGFTVRNPSISSGARDTISQCLLVNTSVPTVIWGGGFLVNSVIDSPSGTSMTISIPPSNFLMVANSVIRTSLDPFTVTTPATMIYLLNNDILPSGTWTTYPGEGNISSDPLFIAPGNYALSSGSPCIDRGAAVGLPIFGTSPDIGALEFGLVYSPLPPLNLTATWNLAAQNGQLNWLPPPGSSLATECRIYRSDSSNIPNDAPVYATLSGQYIFYIDTTVPKGQTWYYQVRYAVNDPVAGWLLSAQSNTASLFANRSPQAVDDTASVNWYSSLAIFVLDSDTDPDGDALTIQSYTIPKHGTMMLVTPPPLPAPQAYFFYTPTPGYFGPDDFTYTISDGHGATATATVSITVNKVNRNPIAIADTATTKAFTPVNIAVLANDSDPDGDPISVEWVSTPAHGTASISSDKKTVLYTPTGAYVGMDTFQYTVIDGKGGFAIAQQVTVTIEPIKFTSSIFIKTTTSGDYTVATAIVTVRDEFGALLPGVSVSGHWSGLTSDSDSSTTGDSGNLLGKVYLDSNSVRRAKGTFTFTIDSAAKSGYTFNTAQSETTKSVLYPPGAGLMHVQSIDLTLNTAKRTVTAKVLVLDDSGVPVSGAQVTVAWSGAATGNTTATTASTGYATLNAPSLRNASGKTLVCTVTAVSKIPWTYEAAANIETSASIFIP